ncbi:hypothetical protein Tco_0881052, partial [Tanacetum coccineum]
SSKEMLIARCGMIPEKLKEIENGKQRKHIKYPSGGRNEGPNCPFRCYVKLGVTVNPYDKTYFDRCEGTTIATTSRGRVGIKRGRGGKTVRLGARRVTSEGTPAARIRRGGQKLGVRRGTSKSTSTAKGRGGHTLGQSQAEIQQQPPQTAEEGTQSQANQNLRPRSTRIMKNRLARPIDGTGSSNTNAQD